MLVLRPTASLAKRMRCKLAPAQLGSSTLLGDWYANGLVLDRKQYILSISEHGRLPVLLTGAPYADFPRRLTPAVGDLLRAIGIPSDAVGRELAQMEPITFAKTANRSLLGSMNELARMLEVHADLGRFRHGDLLATSVWMADMISMALPKVSTPRDVVHLLFGLPEPPRRRLRLL